MVKKEKTLRSLTRNSFCSARTFATATLTYDAGFGGELPRRGGTYAADFVIPLYRGAP